MSYHHEGVSYPQSFPTCGTTGNLDGLTVDCNHHGWSFTHCTPGRTNPNRKLSTLHLSTSTFQFSAPYHPYLLMKGLMPSPVTGAMDAGMGSGVDSQ